MSFDTRLLRVAALLAAAVALPCCSGDVGDGDTVSVVTIRASETTAGLQANGASTSPSFSADGMIVAFSTTATNLTDNDPDGGVLVKDRSTGVIENITNVSTIGVIKGPSSSPVLSADGRFVGFLSSGKYAEIGALFPPTPAIFRPYLYDRVTRNFVVVRDNGWLDDHTTGLALSADGRYMAFATTSKNIGTTNPQGRQQIYLCDFGPNRDLSQVTLVSHASTSLTQGAIGRSTLWSGGISGDGELVVFESWASDLLPAQDAHPGSDAYLWRRSTGALTLISPPSSNTVISERAGISRDGSTIGFITADSALFGQPDFLTLQLYTVATGQRRAIADPARRTEWETVLLSGDGSRVLYRVGSSAFPQLNLYVEGVGFVLVSRSTEGATPTQTAYTPALSENGRWAAWESPATNFVPRDTNGFSDVFIRGPF